MRFASLLGAYARAAGAWEVAWWLATHPLLLCRYAVSTVRLRVSLWQIERLYRQHERRESLRRMLDPERRD